MKAKNIISLESILPPILKKQVDEACRLFVKGINWPEINAVNYEISYGYIEIEGESIFNSNKVFDLISDHVSKHFNMPFNIIISNTRKREIAEKRMILQSLASKYTKFSLAEIGRRTGGRDHATVYYAKKTVRNLVQTNRNFAFIYGTLDAKIKEDILQFRKTKPDEPHED